MKASFLVGLRLPYGVFWVRGTPELLFLRAGATASKSCPEQASGSSAFLQQQLRSEGDYLHAEGGRGAARTNTDVLCTCSLYPKLLVPLTVTTQSGQARWGHRWGQGKSDWSKNEITANVFQIRGGAGGRRSASLLVRSAKKKICPELGLEGGKE